jgi:hypothetical protein
MKSNDVSSTNSQGKNLESSKKSSCLITPVLITLFILVSIIVLLGYTLYTKHIWEDFFITFLCSKNLAEGNGLVYEIGKKVHTFTSPLGVLLPSLTYILTGSSSYFKAIWLFRILFCIPAFIGGGIFALKLLKNNISPKQGGEKKLLIPIVSLALLYIFDVKSVMYTTNGMETGLMLLFFMWALYLLRKGIAENWLITGFVWGGLMWTRPDSCFYIAAIIITDIFFRKEVVLSVENNPAKGQQSIKKTIIGISKTALVTTAVYLPWFLWAWWYYGSPVPNTVLAKSAVNSISLNHFLSNIIHHPSWAFSPVYPNLTQWPSSVAIFSIALSLFASLYWVFCRNNDKLGKKLSFIYFLLSLYFALIPFPYPWYYPPLTILGYLIIINGIWKISQKNSYIAKFAPIIYAVIFLNIFIQFILTTEQMRIQQRIIETGLRKQIGLWLKENTGKNDTIYLEPLGYIGYFSARKMIDYPGLSSPEVVKLLKEKHCNFFTIIPELNPDWIIIRPFKQHTLESMNFFQKQYKYIAHFSAVGKIKKTGYIPGKGYIDYDSVFIIYKKKENRK